LSRGTSSAAAVVVCAAAALALAGCGGGGGGGSSANSHTYVVTPTGGGSLAAGIYVTIVSPVAIPAHLLTSGGNKVVSEAKGPEVCSVTKTVQGSHGPGAFLSGKEITIKINGSNPFTSLACKSLKKATFKASDLGKG
jgi:hypothetical protein